MAIIKSVPADISGSDVWLGFIPVTQFNGYEGGGGVSQIRNFWSVFSVQRSFL